MPLAAAGTTMSDAIVRDVGEGLRLRRHHRRARQLIGIITDGDLRRHMRPDLLDARGRGRDDAQARRRSRPDQLVSEALEMLNSSKITALFVVDGGAPVGIIHVHDLLRAGVA